MAIIFSRTLIFEGKFNQRVFMMDFLDENNLTGLLIGICTFLVIGLFHPVVIKAEYYWGTRCWWLFLLLGIVGIMVALCVRNLFFSALAGVFAFSSFWSILEIFEQRKRVLKGWFPMNPKRAHEYGKESKSTSR